MALLRMGAELIDDEPDAALEVLREIPGEWIFRQYGDVPKAYLAGVAYQQKNDMERARAHFDAARVLLETRLAERPEDESLYRYLSLECAHLGHKERAIRLGEKAVDFMPMSRDFIVGDNFLLDLAKVFTLVGEHEKALERLEYLLSVPSSLYVSILRLVPVWDPLRDHPRFQALLEEYEDVRF